MKATVVKLSIFIFASFLTTSMFGKTIDCPPALEQSFMTMNDDGHSSYIDPDLFKLFKQIHKVTNFNLNMPILDIGAGYGGGTYELIRLGAKNIYANDIDERNIYCMRRHIRNFSKKSSSKVTYLIGNITSKAVLSKLPDKSFSLILAKNIIQFLSYDQLMMLIPDLGKKVSKGGVVVFIFENPYWKKQNLMIAAIFKESHKYPNTPLNAIVKAAYNHVTFPGFRYCSFSVYNKAPDTMKLPGFPCELPLENGFGQLLNPAIIEALMASAGFEVIGGKSFSNKEKPVLLIFKKQANVSKEQFKQRFSSWVKHQLDLIQKRPQ